MHEQTLSFEQHGPIEEKLKSELEHMKKKRTLEVADTDGTMEIGTHRLWIGKSSDCNITVSNSFNFKNITLLCKVVKCLKYFLQKGKHLLWLTLRTLRKSAI
jgi:hypothetical protein